MAQLVLSVGFLFPGGFTEFVPLNSRRSLLDADVIIFRPSIGPFNDVQSQFQGKPSLYDSASFELKNAASHWRQQIQMAVNAGKNVFVLFPKLEEVWVDSGERTYSGTGRNARPTRHVEPFNNYQMLPTFAERILESEGAQMKLNEHSQLLADYWRRFRTRSSYKVTFEGLKVAATITTIAGAVPVACSFGLSGGSGRVIGLPALADYDFEPTNVGNRLRWTKPDKQFGQEFLEAILAIDGTLRAGGLDTPPPAWTSQDDFVLASEHGVKQSILAADGDIEKLLLRKADLEKQLADEGRLRRLLYETGRPLEQAIIEVLRLMGFNAEPFRESDSEFDAVFVSSEGRFIGEAEGKDSKAINIDKLRQLEMNIQEDLARDEVAEPARGVLFGNAYRLQHPNERPPIHFSDKCIKAAKRTGTALVRTVDLFQVGRILKETGDGDYATRCRLALLTQGGQVVLFPACQVPDGLANKLVDGN